MVKKKKKRRPTVRILLFLIVAGVLCIIVPEVARTFFPMDYMGLVSYETQEYGLDPYLVAALIQAESGYNPEAVSKSGAIGLMQLMPDTGEWIAEKIGMDEYTDEMLMNPKINVHLGCWYLSYLIEAYEGNQKLFLAAYNAGKNKVDTWLDTGEIDRRENYYDDIPYKETKYYLKKIENYEKFYRFLYQ